MKRPAAAQYTVLIVDDDEEYSSEVAEVLEALKPGPNGESVRILTERDFTAATTRLADGTVDVLVLDVVDAGEPAGLKHHGVRLFEDVKALQFLPIVFHTGTPATVERHAHTPLVQVVPKGEGAVALSDAVQRAFASELPTIARGLQQRVREVTRDYLWQDAATPNSAAHDHEPLDVACGLTSRLARSLAEPDAAAQALGVRPAQQSRALTYAVENRPAEHLSWGGAEDARVERYEDFVLVAWTTRLSPVQAVLYLLKSAEPDAEMLIDMLTGSLDNPDPAELTALTQRPEDLRLVRVENDAATLIWQVRWTQDPQSAAPGTREQGPPSAEVAVLFDSVDADQLARLIEQTGTRQVVDNLPQVLAVL